MFWTSLGYLSKNFGRCSNMQMAKNSKLGKPTKEAKILGEKAESLIDQMPQKKRQIIVVVSILFLIFASVVAYLFFRYSSSLSSINERKAVFCSSVRSSWLTLQRSSKVFFSI